VVQVGVTQNRTKIKSDRTGIRMYLFEEPDPVPFLCGTGIRVLVKFV
jgi:hypothetical protein